jgi:glycosyltransferase involved in cell wall biosynthesis
LKNHEWQADPSSSDLMRFLLLNQYYPPDVAPTGQYLHDLARGLVQRGHTVKVLCSQRSYDGTKRFSPRETLDGVEIVRLAALGFGRRSFAGKMADYASFYGMLLVSLILESDRPDLILSLTTPPYIGLLGRFAAQRHGCRHAHWIMDLYPDVMYAHGLARREGLIFRLLSKLTTWQFQGADTVLTLGPMMANRVAGYCPDRAARGRVRWLPLWSNAELKPCGNPRQNELRRERGWADGEVVLLYSGNMGLGHRFGEFLEVASRLSDVPIRWVFAGSGKRRQEIETLAKAIPAARIQFLGYVPSEKLQAHLCSADIHLASLDAAWQGMMVPSKLQGSFAVGRPVIYVGGQDCESALWIRQSGGGWAASEGDLEGLMTAIKEALDPVERQKRGDAALLFAQKRFHKLDSVATIAQWLEGKSEVDRAVVEAASPADALQRQSSAVETNEP